MNDLNYEEMLSSESMPSSDEWLEALDEDDLRYILLDFDEEEAEATFRWEYQHEGLSTFDSVFKKIMPDS